MTATIDLVSTKPLGRREAVELGRVEYRRFVDALRDLTDDDWSKPTDCEGWTVRDLAGHLAGAMMTASSIVAFGREQLEVLRRRRRTGEDAVDAMTALQVDRVAHLGTGELVARMDSLVDAAADGRHRLPDVLARAVRAKVEMGAISERWSLDYLWGPILTRDTWLHRVADLAHAVGRPPVLDAAHDGRIVADVAAEWARRHGENVELVLDGPAGGHFVAAGAASASEERPLLQLDAVEFCRMLSGRAEPAHPLLSTAVPF